MFHMKHLQFIFILYILIFSNLNVVFEFTGEGFIFFVSKKYVVCERIFTAAPCSIVFTGHIIYLTPEY